MASFYGYVILIIGLSLLFAIAGVNSGMGHLLGTYATVTPQSPTQNLTVTTTQFQWNGIGGSAWLIALYLLLGAFVVASGIRIVLGGTQGIAETIKTTVALAILGFMISDVIGLLTYLNGVPDWGGIIKIAALVVYLPLAVGMIISAIDWIGGGR